jgi:hypothetical protein
MVNKFTNIHIEDCGTGISMPSDAPVEFNGLTIKGCVQAIEMRDPPSLLTSLGLPSDTPPQLLIEALNILQANSSSPLENKTEILQTSSLFNWLGASANLTSITGLLIQAQQNGYVNSIINMFPK